MTRRSGTRSGVGAIEDIELSSYGGFPHRLPEPTPERRHRRATRRPGRPDSANRYAFLVGKMVGLKRTKFEPAVRDFGGMEQSS